MRTSKSERLHELREEVLRELVASLRGRIGCAHSGAGKETDFAEHEVVTPSQGNLGLSGLAGSALATG